MTPRERALHVASILAVVYFVYWHSAYRSQQPAVMAGTVLPEQRHAVIIGARHLLSDTNDSETDNCTSLRHFQNYNNSCDFVRQECTNKRVLFDYLSFTLCDCGRVKVCHYCSCRAVTSKYNTCFLYYCYQHVVAKC